ncbi:MAG TPA: DUF5985 family protein [Azospirillaceae bacterium]|nr:DUF5985 family protein [Azospirillaceae bacterium]
MRNPQAIVYLLCFAASALCLTLLVRSYLQRRARLLLWSALSFVGLAMNNLLVFLDLIILPHIDLTPARSLSALAAVGVLLYGFIWDTD